jgi:uncharacterized repeat protein (TIGR04076 family)
MEVNTKYTSQDGGFTMVRDPGFGTKIKCEVVGLKGACNVGHKIGDTFEVSCYHSGGMCGFLYNTIFPVLNVMQFGGAYPWGCDELQYNCPDGHNLLTVKLTRAK